MVKNPLAGSGRCSRRGRGPWVGKTPWGRARPPALVFLPGESNGQRSLAATAQKAVKSPTRLKQLRVLGSTGLSGDGGSQFPGSWKEAEELLLESPAGIFIQSGDTCLPSWGVPALSFSAFSFDSSHH